MWLLLFIIVPAVELYLLVVIGSRITVTATVGLIVLTGFIGWKLVKMQGLATLRRIQEETAQGRLPAQELVAGLCLLGAGLLLITPGFLTDTVGFLILIPPLRRWVARLLMARYKVRVAGSLGGLGDPGGPTGPGGPGGEVIDIPAEDVKTYEPGEGGTNPSSKAGND